MDSPWTAVVEILTESGEFTGCLQTYRDFLLSIYRAITASLNILFFYFTSVLKQERQLFISSIHAGTTCLCKLIRPRIMRFQDVQFRNLFRNVFNKIVDHHGLEWRGHQISKGSFFYCDYIETLSSNMRTRGWGIIPQASIIVRTKAKFNQPSHGSDLQKTVSQPQFHTLYQFV